MKSQQKIIKELKTILEKKHGREVTDEELSAAHEFAMLWTRILNESSLEEALRREKLNEHPNGFHLEGGFTCLVCGLSVANGNFWYDKNGIKCMLCQKALDKKLIAKSVINNKDSWYSTYDLERYFNMNRADITKYVKSGLLKKRIVPSDGRKPHLELFLVKDNKGVLPPKKLLLTKLVKVIRDGEEYFTREEWYECIDDKGAQRLQKYKIAGILKETFARPILSRRVYFKSTHPLFLMSE